MELICVLIAMTEDAHNLCLKHPFSLESTEHHHSHLVAEFRLIQLHLLARDYRLLGAGLPFLHGQPLPQAYYLFSDIHLTLLLPELCSSMIEQSN